MTNPQLQPKFARYGVFTGELDADAMRQITSVLSRFTDPRLGVESIHLLLHSTGGEISGGVALYNFFKAFPLKLILYNCGTVGSAAVSAFLGARHRRASIHATFAIHKSFMTISGGTRASDLQTLVDRMRIDDERVEAIYREAEINLTDAQWKAFANNEDITFSAKDSLKVGLIQEIAEFTPPSGTTLFTFY